MLSFLILCSALELFCWEEIYLTNSSYFKCKSGPLFQIQQVFCLHSYLLFLYINDQCLIVPKWWDTSLRSIERLGGNSGYAVLQHLKTLQKTSQKVKCRGCLPQTCPALAPLFGLTGAQKHSSGHSVATVWKCGGCLLPAEVVLCILLVHTEQSYSVVSQNSFSSGKSSDLSRPGHNGRKWFCHNFLCLYFPKILKWNHT